MSEENLKRILINIAGRNYPVKLKSNEIDILKTIEKELNKKINDFQIEYEGKDIQDYMSLALISYAFDLHKAKNSIEKEHLAERLSEIENLLDS